jgi:putative nucleotidyltransferase with HDIG domain
MTKKTSLTISPIRFFKAQRLAAKGLSCGKTRRSVGEPKLTELLEGSPYIRAAVILAAAGLLTWFCFLSNPVDPLRNLLYVLLILAVVVIHPVIARGGALEENSRLALFLFLILLQVGTGSLLLREAASGQFGQRLLPLLVPYALAPLTISVLLGPQNGFWAALAASLWWMILPSSPDVGPLLFGVTGGMAAVLSTLRVRRRSRLLRAGFYSGTSVCVLGILTGEIGPVLWDSPLATDWQGILLGCAAALGTGVFTAVLVSGTLPLLEQAFGITTGISWLEMADLNHPILRRLSLEAPGTYHHSLAMANLAESCAEKVGANATLCRVGAYFHDVGKLAKPEYFTENAPAGENPHDELTPTMSALVIISHVKEGVDLAVRNRLNRNIVDLIRQHHGTTLVEYFYQRACRQESDARTGGNLLNVRPEDIPRVSQESFRYPGPKPQTLEAVILGLADAAESASRSLERATPQRLDDLVHEILNDRIEDGQFDEAPVTLCQLHAIAESLVTSLGSMHHARIAYRRRSAGEESALEAS